MTTVIVLGGGVGGMSAAHELVERGFTVRVFERQELPGGKARSVSVTGTGTEGRPDLPGEHGFRFFPRFYRHIIDTMQRIPVEDGRSAADNLVQASRDEIALDGKAPIVIPAWFPRTLADVRVMLSDPKLIAELHLTPDDEEEFATRVWQLMTSSRERAVQEYERLPWSTFLGSKHQSEAFRRFLVGGLTRTLVAATPEEASTEVGGTVLTELVFATARPGTGDDRLLNGPTNDVWLTPWLAHLRGAGVDYHLNAEVTAIHCDGERITGVTVVEDGQESVVTGDHYVAAVPVERMAPLVSKAMREADPILRGITELAGDVAWMTGIQIYLSERRPIVNGHVTFIETPWALTSISQAQFWQDYDLSTYGDGTVRDILSIDISEWNKPGMIPPHKTARECTPEEFAHEVWEQIKHAVNRTGDVTLTNDLNRGWHLDYDITRAHGVDSNAEPLLVNKAGRWNLRPTAHTGIPNLFLASDYVRTNTNLATMEAANEAARRAVNSIIDATGVDAPYCTVWPLYRPWALAPLRWHDARRYARGLPWDPRPPFPIRVVHWITSRLGHLVSKVRKRH